MKKSFSWWFGRIWARLVIVGILGMAAMVVVPFILALSKPRIYPRDLPKIDETTPLLITTSSGQELDVTGNPDFIEGYREMKWGAFLTGRSQNGKEGKIVIAGSSFKYSASWTTNGYRVILRQGDGYWEGRKLAEAILTKLKWPRAPAFAPR